MKNTTKSTRKLFISAILSLIVIFFIGQGQAVSAASAVAFDSQRSVYGYSYNFANRREAQTAALGSCEKHGGQSCRIIVACAGKGYGVLYFRRLAGRPIEAIGASCGAATVGEAQNIASNQCRRAGRGQCAGPKVGWNDTVGTVQQTISYPRRTPVNQPKTPTYQPPQAAPAPAFSEFTTNIRQKIIPGQGYAVVANFGWRAGRGEGRLKVSVQVKSSVTYRNWTNVLSNQSSADVGSWMVRGVPGERFYFRAVVTDVRGRTASSRIIWF